MLRLRKDHQGHAAQRLGAQHPTLWGQVPGAVVGALAAYRLTRLITRDEITSVPRQTYISWAERNQRPLLAYWPQCPWCAGLWVAAGVIALRRFAPELWRPVEATLALSAVIGFLAELETDWTGVES